MNGHKICPKSAKIFIENLVQCVFKGIIIQDCKCRNCVKIMNEVKGMSADEEISTLLNDNKPAINDEFVPSSEEYVGIPSSNVEPFSGPSLLSLCKAQLLSAPIIETDFFRR